MPLETTAHEVYLRSVLDAIPSPVLVVDDQLRVQDANEAAVRHLGSHAPLIARKLCGEILHCTYALNSAEGCGTTDHCPSCGIRLTIATVAETGAPARRMARMHLERDGEIRDFWYMVTAAPFKLQDQPRVLLIMEDVSEVVELRRLIPVCSSCRKVRDDASFWQDVHEYLRRHAGVQFSHGLCPDCMRRLHPEDADTILSLMNEPPSETPPA